MSCTAAQHNRIPPQSGTAGVSVYLLLYVRRGGQEAKSYGDGQAPSESGINAVHRKTFCVLGIRAWSGQAPRPDSTLEASCMTKFILPRLCRRGNAGGRYG